MSSDKEYQKHMTLVKPADKKRGGVGSTWRCNECARVVTSNYGLARRHYLFHLRIKKDKQAI